MNLQELRTEKTVCSNLKSAISGLVSQLTSFSKRFSDCSGQFSAGGFLIDGVAADKYSFGGFSEYASKKISPMIDVLNGASSTLTVAITQIEGEIRRLEEEERRKAREEEAARLAALEKIK